MKKIIEGIKNYHQNVVPNKIETFKEMAKGQSPEALIYSCADSRVMPTFFTNSDPGELFVVRNVGNIVPHADQKGEDSEVSGLEFAVEVLGVKNIIVCGHSDCGAMKATESGAEKLPYPHLCRWLSSNHEIDLKIPKGMLASHDHLSQNNVLKQIENLKSHQVVSGAIEKGELQLHAWWYELSTGLVYLYSAKENQFKVLN